VSSGNFSISALYLQNMMNDFDGDSGDVRLAPSNDVLNDQADVDIISLPQPLCLERKRVKRLQTAAQVASCNL
jgi:hypothetical protein